MKFKKWIGKRPLDKIIASSYSDVMQLEDKYKQRYRTLGLNIAYYRKLRGMTQEQLAEKAGVERSRISKTEIAWVGTSLDVVYKIADALEVEPYKLLMERD